MILKRRKKNMKIGPEHIPDELFKEIVDKMPICTVDIVFFNPSKNKILLCKRANPPFKNIYLTNGGRLLKNEELEDCAARKAKEELGITIDKSKLIFGGVMNMITNKSIYDNISYHAMGIFFGYIVDEETTITLEEQHTEFKWFSIKEGGFNPSVERCINFLIQKI